jgi:hypothetical protein
MRFMAAMMGGEQPALDVTPDVFIAVCLSGGGVRNGGLIDRAR